VRKLLDGLTAEDAAAELTIGIETVRSHIRQIYSKMGVRSREALFQRIMPYCF
jgi:DNA-binding CsgD family transcriptional regulator